MAMLTSPGASVTWKRPSPSVETVSSPVAMVAPAIGADEPRSSTRPSSSLGDGDGDGDGESAALKAKIRSVIRRSGLDSFCATKDAVEWNDARHCAHLHFLLAGGRRRSSRAADAAAAGGLPRRHEARAQGQGSRR